MTRKLHCVLKPTNLTFFKMAADQHRLPFEAEHDTNSSGEPLVRVWISLNYAAYAENVVTPAYKHNVKEFVKLFRSINKEQS